MADRIALVPLDGSATAEAVLPWAVTVAKALGLHLHLVQLVREAWPGGNVQAEAALQPARHYLHGVSASLTTAGIEPETLAQPVGEDIAAGIVGVARSLNAAMIMLATHGHTGVRRLVMGSIADAVVRSATCPVLVVRGGEPREHPEQAIRRVLLPLDGSALSEMAMDEAVQIASATGATLDLMQAVPWLASLFATGQENFYIPPGLDEQMEKAATDYLKQALQRVASRARAEYHVLRGDAAGAILDYAERTGVDLIVMSTHGRSGIARWALGSVADKVLRAGDRPVLLVRGEDEPDETWGGS